MRYIVFIFLLIVCFIPEIGLAATPDVKCGNLPGCDKGAITGTDGGGVYPVIGNLIATMIKYVAVIAVIAVMIGGIMYLISSGEEEKTKKARTIIIWALAGVFISALAWSLISILNNFRI